MPAPSGRNVSATWRVLVVESNVSDKENLVTWLRRQGHDVYSVETGSEAVRLHHNADLVLLDLELPDLDGIEVCRAIRAVCDVPLIAVTARSAELDCVLGLQSGADDYLVKPYGFRELMARIDAVMRRARPRAAPAPTVSRGSLRIDAKLREVILAGKRIELTRKEFDLLYLLASHPETVVPRSAIMEQVWGDSWSRRTVDTHVSSLRNKLGSNEWIVTVRGVGFRLGEG
ncbi:response regulator transcription factor [Actinosynnema sp. NPDC050436]|uniref:response regulator transcription factor n=1 Tax=Actinosynnema sp. NPDC050436 TaxID=3155659 RepID=UPI0033D995E4